MEDGVGRREGEEYSGGSCWEEGGGKSTVEDGVGRREGEEYSGGWCWEEGGGEGVGVCWERGVLALFQLERIPIVSIHVSPCNLNPDSQFL